MKKEKQMKKKAVIFFNRAGGAHVAAAAAIARVLEPTYDVVQIDFSKQFIHRVQVLTHLTRGKIHSDGAYNFMLKHGLYRTLNFLGGVIVPGWMRRVGRRFERWVKLLLKEEQAELVISTIPIVNAPIIRAARELGLPLVITTLDGDLRHWKIGIKGVDYARLGFTIALNEAACRKEIEALNLPSARVVYAGMPVREEFLKAHDKAQARESLGIPAEAFVVMVLMGGIGQSSMPGIVKGLLKGFVMPAHAGIQIGYLGENGAMPAPATGLDPGFGRGDNEVVTPYVIACVGKNDALRTQIEADLDDVSKKHVRVLGYTENIAELMAASDLLVTKSGPTSILEAVYMGLPMVVDGTLPALSHERSHHDFVRNAGIGVVVGSRKDIPHTVAALMADPAKMEQMSQAARSLQRPDFATSFMELIRAL
jgi:UDP-N-acetylglucosamine:LPS N-acetylglucosamine transferase